MRTTKCWQDNQIFEGFLKETGCSKDSTLKRFQNLLKNWQLILFPHKIWSFILSFLRCLNISNPRQILLQIPAVGIKISISFNSNSQGTCVKDFWIIFNPFSWFSLMNFWEILKVRFVCWILGLLWMGSIEDSTKC